MTTIPEHERVRLEAVAHDDLPLEDLIARRLRGEPLQYIEGTAAFGPLDLLVDERVLIPRPETEGMFELATRMVRSPEIIVDLCTGSGALALALKSRFPSAAVFATDISPDAVEVATDNRYRTGLQIYLAEGDLFDPFPRRSSGLSISSSPIPPMSPKWISVRCPPTCSGSRGWRSSQGRPGWRSSSGLEPRRRHGSGPGV